MTSITTPPRKVRTTPPDAPPRKKIVRTKVLIPLVLKF